MKSIFTYIDYRLYLANLYDEKKRTTRYFSYRYFSTKAGINSPNFLKLVIDGKRDLTPATISKFSIALNFNEKEGLFFKHLVLFNQAKTSVEKQEHYAVLLSMMDNIREQQVTIDQYEFYTTWYVSAIRELITLVNFNEDYNLLGSLVHPVIKAREAREAVKLLERLHFIERKGDGMYRQLQAAIRTDPNVVPLGVRNFHRSIMDRAKESLDTVSRSERNFLTSTIGISPQTYSVIVAELNAFMDRITTIVNRDESSSRVYQLNLQLFPLSKDINQATLRDNTV